MKTKAHKISRYVETQHTFGGEGGNCIAMALPSFALQAPPQAHGQIILPAPDFGDAPDSINNHPNVATNTAYPGVPGRFPTVWDGTLPFGAAGPKHLNPIWFFWAMSSGEADADLAPDSDGRLNILDGGADNSDNDKFDDGWLNPNVRLHNCTVVPLKVRISRSIALFRRRHVSQRLVRWQPRWRLGRPDTCPFDPLDELPIGTPDALVTYTHAFKRLRVDRAKPTHQYARHPCGGPSRFHHLHQAGDEYHTGDSRIGCASTLSGQVCRQPRSIVLSGSCRCRMGVA